MMRIPFLFAPSLGIAIVLLTSNGLGQNESVSKDQAIQALDRAAQFFHRRVAVEGGYVYQVSADLRYREGEGDAGRQAVWVQPPGTPAVGMAFLQAHQRTGSQVCLDAALDAARCLLRGQLHSGGWQKSIEFDPDLRAKQAYRIDGPRRAKAKNWSSFDDDQTQSAVRFLISLDKQLKMEDRDIHQATLAALQSIVDNQYPNGGWAQGFEEKETNLPSAELRASYPESWSRTHPKADYWKFYTLNDNALVRILDTLWLAFDTYQDDHYRKAAIRGADFLLLAQMPDPQPAWAQQYDFQMHPVWARKFEPPAVSGRESQDAIDALLQTYLRTQDSRYLAAAQKAWNYLHGVQLPSGKMARFYELQSNKPLYFTREYELTYDDSDVPTHYAFQTPSDLTSLKKKLDQLEKTPLQELSKLLEKRAASQDAKRVTDKEVANVLRSMNSEGAWIEPGKLRYIKTKDHDGQMILSSTFIKNLDLLGRAIASQAPASPLRP